MIDLKKSARSRKVAYVACGNAAITVAVLLSPFGIAAGSAFIGNSIIRLVILVFVQLPMTLAGFKSSYTAFRQGVPWRAWLVANIAIILFTVAVYFAQSQIARIFFGLTFIGDELR